MKILIHVGGSGVGGNETLLRDLMSDSNSERRNIEYVLVTLEEGAHSFLGEYASEIRRIQPRLGAWEHLFAEVKPDLVLGLHGDIYNMALAAKRSGIPAIWSCGHPFIDNELAPLSLLFERIIAQSYYLAQQLTDRAGETLTHLSVIQNGIDTEKFRPTSQVLAKQCREKLGISEQAFLVGYPARLADYKCHLDLIEVIARLFPRTPEFHLLCLIGKDLSVGAQTIWKDISRKITGVGKEYEQRIHFVSGLPDGMPTLYSALDCLVFPAVNEGLGCAVLEAMAMGLPVIVSQSGGLQEILSPFEEKDCCGMFVPPRDLTALALAIDNLSREPELRIQMGRSGRKRIEDMFSKSHMVKQYQTVFHELGGYK